MERPSGIQELRRFGLLVGGIFVVIGCWPLVFREEPVRLWALGLGAPLILLGAIRPGLLGPLHTLWMRLGHVLGWINTRILLALVFYGLVTPIGLIFRLMGKDPMRLVRREGPTYRVLREPRQRGHMKFQF